MKALGYAILAFLFFALVGYWKTAQDAQKKSDDPLSTDKLIDLPIVLGNISG